MTTYTHIDAGVNIIRGEEARRRLEQENDRPFVRAGQGIVAVPVERWRKAQVAEHTHWFVRSITADTDRNEQHFAGFNGYRALRGARFAHAIELGCGPFTNMRLIAATCRVGDVTLLDPLIEKYFEHPFCGYTRQWLYLQSAAWLRVPAGLRRPVDRLRLWRRYPNWYHRLRQFRRVPVAGVLACPIEQMPTDQRYDLLAIINVIEHCFDIQQIFRNILTVLKPGGKLVFHDRYYDGQQVAQATGQYYDAAHPLRVDRGVIDEFLERHFACDEHQITRSAFDHDEHGNPVRSGHDNVYFIGTRRG